MPHESRSGIHPMADVCLLHRLATEVQPLSNPPSASRGDLAHEKLFAGSPNIGNDRRCEAQDIRYEPRVTALGLWVVGRAGAARTASSAIGPSCIDETRPFSPH